MTTNGNEIGKPDQKMKKLNMMQNVKEMNELKTIKEREGPEIRGRKFKCVIDCWKIL